MKYGIASFDEVNKVWLNYEIWFDNIYEVRSCLRKLVLHDVENLPAGLSTQRRKIIKDNL